LEISFGPIHFSIFKKRPKYKKKSPDFVCLLLRSGFDFFMEAIASWSLLVIWLWILRA
jgi:hypothetical protein